jgi:hypothetical protein
MSVGFLVQHMTVAQHYSSHIAFGSDTLLLNYIQNQWRFFEFTIALRDFRNKNVIFVQ